MNTKFKELPASNMSVAKRKLVHGVGINDANYIVQPIINGKKLFCPSYVLWVNMLNRCYAPYRNITDPTYKECFVCDEWLVFSNFKSWLENQDYQNKVLDKDILLPNNKEYSPHKCLLVSQQINNLRLDYYAKQGLYLRGVSLDKRNNMFRARCNLTWLGYFDNELDAHKAYCLCKAKFINEIAQQQTDVRLRNALISWVTDILNF